MSQFPKVSADHPLAEAARAVDAMAGEHGMGAVVEWLGMDVSDGELAYVGEQRALRAVAAAELELGANLEAVANELRLVMIACYMDGIAIGWRARQITEAHDGDS